MARGEGALPKSIAHFQIWLSVFVDLHRAKDHERKSISVLRVDPHAHRGMRYGHTNNPVHLPNSYARRLHIVKDNKLHKGLDAFLIVWEEIPRYKILFKFARLPIIYNIGWLIYEFIALLLYVKNKKLIK